MARQVINWLVGARAFLAYMLLLILNFAHPFLHAFEGGALDMMLPYINMFAMQWEGYRHEAHL